MEKVEQCPDLKKSLTVRIFIKVKQCTHSLLEKVEQCPYLKKSLTVHTTYFKTGLSRANLWYNTVWIILSAFTFVTKNKSNVTNNVHLQYSAYRPLYLCNYVLIMCTIMCTKRTFNYYRYFWAPDSLKKWKFFVLDFKSNYLMSTIILRP